MDGGSAADGAGFDFGEADAADFAFLDAGGEGGDAGFDRGGGVDTRGLEDVDRTFPVKDTETLVNGAADVFLRTIWAHFAGGEAAFDGEDDFAGVGGVFGEVLVDEVAGVELGGAVEFAGVPEVGVDGEGDFHCVEGLRDGWRGVAPGHPHEAQADRPDGLRGQVEGCHDWRALVVLRDVVLAMLSRCSVLGFTPPRVFDSCLCKENCPA